MIQQCQYLLNYIIYLFKQYLNKLYLFFNSKIFQIKQLIIRQTLKKLKNPAKAQEDMYVEYLRDKVEDPFWKGILSGQYENLGSQIDVIKSEIQKNRFEMKQQISTNLNDYVKSQESAIKLSQELSKIRKTSQGMQLKEKLKSFRITQAPSPLNSEKINSNKNDLQNKSSPNSQQVVLLQKQSLFEKFKRCQQESDFMEIFEVENVIQKCLKSEEYDELSKLLFWLEKLILKNRGNQSLYNMFNEIMKKYRNVLCNILFQTYTKSKKEKLKKFFIDFGKNLKSQKDSYIFEIFQAHFSKKFKQIFDNNKTQLTQVNHIANIFEIYAKSLNKSILFIQEINDQLREKEQIKILQFVNKFRKNLIDLIDKVKGNKLNEIKIRLKTLQEPLKTFLKLGAVRSLQISYQTKSFLQKVGVFLRFKNNGLTILKEFENINQHTPILANQNTQKSQGFLVLANTLKAYQFILQVNIISQTQINDNLNRFVQQIDLELKMIISLNQATLQQELQEVEEKRKTIIIAIQEMVQTN